MTRAYILLQRKTIGVGPGVGLDPQRHNFALGIRTCWYLKMRKFALPPMPNLKLAFHPTRNPNASQWNIGCIGFSGVGACVGHVHFRLFHLRLIANANAVFSGIWA